MQITTIHLDNLKDKKLFRNGLELSCLNNVFFLSKITILPFNFRSYIT
jgi:hypothetical protein